MKKVVVLAFALVLAACSGNSRMTTGQIIGAISGGIVGSYIGTRLGGGTGSLLFVVAGTAMGSLAGYAYGDSLIPSDRAEFKNSAKVAMDIINDGQVYSWSNPVSGVVGTITPVRSYFAEKGQFCRDFDATIAAESGIGSAKGRACRVGPNAWYLDARV